MPVSQPLTLASPEADSTRGPIRVLKRPDWRRGLGRLGQERLDLYQTMTAFAEISTDFRESLELYDHACLASEFWAAQPGQSARALQLDYEGLQQEMAQDIFTHFRQM